MAVASILGSASLRIRLSAFLDVLVLSRTVFLSELPKGHDVIRLTAPKNFDHGLGSQIPLPTGSTCRLSRFASVRVSVDRFPQLLGN
jgi:hypothetical protein